MLDGVSANAEPIEPALVARWEDERRKLDRALDAESGGPWTWLWEIRVKIYNYLLDRYAEGGRINPDDLPLVVAASQPATRKNTPAPPAATRQTEAPRPTAAARPLRTPASSRLHLQRIADCNAERHAIIEQHRTNPSWFGTLTYDDFDTLAKSIRIRRYRESTEDTLSGEEIAEMIFGNIDSDSV